MKTLLISMFLVCFGCSAFFAQNTTTTTTTTQSSTNTTTMTKSIKKTYPHYSIGITGGAIFPLPKVLNQTFKPGGNFDLDFGVRINKEVGAYLDGSYSFMSSKISGAPVGSYFEFSGGPRYYFMNPKLKSQLFFEAGVGAYYFRQNGYEDPNSFGTVAQIANTKPGINGGVGASMYLSDAVDILFKTKYNLVFTPNGSSSFINVGAGLEFSFK